MYCRGFNAGAPSRAMQDVYAKVREPVGAVLETLQPAPYQADAVRGRLVGLDLLSTPAAFAELHEKIVRSYAIEAPRDASNPDAGAEDPAPSSAKTDPAAIVRDALDGVAAESWRDHPAIGLGTDARPISPHRDAAAPVAHQDYVIHLAAFPKAGAHQSGVAERTN